MDYFVSADNDFLEEKGTYLYVAKHFLEILRLI